MSRESFSYAKLTDAQKWQWHAEGYALRRVTLDVPRDVRTSPCDTKGNWFKEELVDEAERQLREKFAEQARRGAASTRDANAIRFADAKRWRESPEGQEFLGRLHQNHRKDAAE